MSERFDLVVVGAGPAGLRAATEAASRGLRVVVLDEHPEPGGRLLGQLHERPGGEGADRWWNGIAIAAGLADEARAAGVTIRCGEAVWSLEPGWTVLTEAAEGVRTYDADRILVATGASEDPAPVPGWERPGVYSIGGAQVLVNVHRVRPGRSAVVIGVNLLSLSIARELDMAGVDVRAIVLPPQIGPADPRGRPDTVVPKLLDLARFHPSPTLRLMAGLARSIGAGPLAARFFPRSGLPAWGVPVRAATACTAILGDDQGVTHVELAALTADGRPRSSRRERMEVDTVCIAGGLTPLGELAAAAGARFADLPDLGGYVPLHDPDYETTQPGLFVAGNVIGIEGAEVAMAQGEAAGLAICRRAGVEGVHDDHVASARERVSEVRGRTEIRFLDDVEGGRRAMRARWEEVGRVASGPPG